jgi:hypothetical protein
MKSNDQILLEEAYKKIKKTKLDTVGKEDTDLNNDGEVNSSDEYLKKRRAAIAQAKEKKENTKKKVGESLESAYERILESKYINKKFARRYNKVTAALLKAEPGSENYQKLKSERDDLVGILKDHGKSVSDLEELLAKKEKENPLPDTDFSPNVDQQYGDNSYSDTADLHSNVIPGEFNNSGTSAEITTPEIPVAVGQ